MWILKTEYLGRTGAPLMGCFVDSIRLTASDSQIRPISVFGSIGFRQMEDCCLTARRELFFIGIDGPFPDAILWERRAECPSGAPPHLSPPERHHPDVITKNVPPSVCWNHEFHGPGFAGSTG